MRKFFIVFFCGIFYSFFTQSVFACENCPVLKANRDTVAGAYIFKQLMFENKQDLVIVTPQAETKRVTFNRGDASISCYFQPIAFAQGGDWGWHMLWAEPLGLYYARMDGEAWVSSNPKRFTKLMAINPQFKLENQTIAVTWQQVENGVTASLQALSSDEGRSWEVSVVPH
jgi:hypothetical protein